MLRNLLLTSVAIAAFSTAAFAADLPSRKAPMAEPYVAPPIFTWTGFYVGAAIGGGWTNDNARIAGAGGVIATENMNSSGVVGGLYAGYNYQFSNAIVLGLEADVDATSISKTSGVINVLGGPPFLGNADKESIPWQGSLRGRLGYAIDHVLLYATGGFAFGGINTSYATAGVPGSLVSFNGTQTGWTVGGGLEYAFNANWIGRVEYRYTQFSAFTDNPVAPGNALAAFNVRHNVSENAVKVGIAYKFGAPASAVVAKY